MGLFGKKKKNIETASLSELSDAERSAAIERTENIRGDVVVRIEDLMVRIAAVGKGKMKRLKRRKHKLGRAPNDVSPEGESFI